MLSVWIISAITAFAVLTNSAWAQAAKNLTGTWVLVSVTTERPDGNKIDSLGENPKGRLDLNVDGSYMIYTAAADFPKFASNDRFNGTPEDYKSVVYNSIAYIGKYSETDHTIIFNIESCTYPNWSGTIQKRNLVRAGDDTLQYSFAPPGPAAERGTVTLIWQRGK